MATQIIPESRERPMRAKQKKAPVLRLIDCAKDRATRDREYVATILEGLLAKARRGEVAGLAMAVKMSDGAEHEIFVGSYEASLAEAANAALRMAHCAVLDQLQN